MITVLWPFDGSGNTLYNLLICFTELLIYIFFSRQKKSIHIPFRSKYNRVTKRARYLHENPSCMLCNILHRYLQQADYTVIEEATMVSLKPTNCTFWFYFLLQSAELYRKQLTLFEIIHLVWKAIVCFSIFSIPEWWRSSPCDAKEGAGSSGQTMDEIYCGNSRFQGYWSDKAQPTHQTQRASAEPGRNHHGPGQRRCAAEWHKCRRSWIWIWRRWELTAFSLWILCWPMHLLPQMDCYTLNLSFFSVCVEINRLLLFASREEM